ncbi:glycerol-3-phosphate dehydrogenase [Priestia aryabhattai]|uniref:glycerol-3-phosphate dehydrogenase/oxidase n=1 Tax=Priestia TaxID=2800373 RepID=UPI000BA07046|nr:glycerol-3-phosphate dehydrogenase/oxidase [Priestia flexa]MBY6024266.1 glycerol-3-phosphate dehydrogenase/oxidase [Nitratireductor sp. DP7N14-4]MDT2048237.1 glycerol-3-phosphate dehydrogenase/oxidase [Priestia flexa]OZT11405.1 glycerol-3-phosphate dehydrogenase [Priestia aryabhattai]USY55679.1 glycerol-3-phosphate dehydrogenase/oxidase [Bacillus sp. 1780r2a1]
MFSSKMRVNKLEEMTTQKYDLLVIGGGITGSGIALDAANRGMKTALVEMQDFASGTSSRSTKLVHGGLRYLKQFEVKMVAEVGKERAIVYENGPHVTTPEWMLLPFHTGGTFGKYSTSVGLRVYDYLAGVKRSERRKMFSAEETLKREPLVKSQDLKGGGYYVEYKTDDARLTIEVAKEAANRGADLVNYTKVDEFIYDNGTVIGAVVVDQITKRSYKIHAKKIVNAAGPWVDSLREKDNSKKGKQLQLTKGIHLVIDQKRFPLQQAIYFDTPDGRMVFAIPRDGKTYVGTTDTVYKEDARHPQMTVKDREYVIDAINYMFPTVNITVDDVESSWAGVRPLIHEEGKDPSEISRKDEVWTSHSGLITIAGGKLTGYRKMAELVVNTVAEQLKAEGNAFKPSQTKYLPISGGDVGGSKNFPKFVEEKVKVGVELGLSPEAATKLVKRYGSNIDLLYRYMTDYKDKMKASNLPASVFLQVQYGIEEEMVTKPIDLFIRRTGALFFDIAWVREWKEAVIKYMAQELSWTPQQTSEYSQELNKHLHDAVVPVDEKGSQIADIS